MRCHTVFVITISVLIPIARLSPQQLPAVEFGARVRVTAPVLGIDQYPGMLRAVEPDTLVIDELRIALPSVTLLEVSRVQKSSGNAAFLVGGSAGFLIGLEVAQKTAACTEGEWFENFDDCMGAGAVAGLVGGVVGGLLGNAIWKGIRPERWEEVPLDCLRVGFAPKRDGGLALGLTVSF